MAKKEKCPMTFSSITSRESSVRVLSLPRIHEETMKIPMYFEAINRFYGYLHRNKTLKERLRTRYSWKMGGRNEVPP